MSCDGRRCGFFDGLVDQEPAVARYRIFRFEPRRRIVHAGLKQRRGRSGLQSVLNGSKRKHISKDALPELAQTVTQVLLARNGSSTGTAPHVLPNAEAKPAEGNGE